MALYEASEFSQSAVWLLVTLEPWPGNTDQVIGNNDEQIQA